MKSVSSFIRNNSKYGAQFLPSVKGTFMLGATVKTNIVHYRHIETLSSSESDDSEKIYCSVSSLLLSEEDRTSSLSESDKSSANKLFFLSFSPE